MTVIAYRDGYLAADRMCSDGAIVHGYRTKVFSFRGSLGAACGPSQDCVAFRQWLELADALRIKPELSDDFTGFVVSPDGTVLQYDHRLVPYVVEAHYFAEGDGYAVALGAKYMGATAEQAVLAACHHVLGCGGGVDVLRLDAPSVEPSASAAATPKPSMGTMGT